MDDVIIPSEDEEEGLNVVKRVIEVAFWQRRVEHLGCTIDDGRVNQHLQRSKSCCNPLSRQQ